MRSSAHLRGGGDGLAGEQGEQRGEPGVKPGELLGGDGDDTEVRAQISRAIDASPSATQENPRSGRE